MSDEIELDPPDYSAPWAWAALPSAADDAERLCELAKTSDVNRGDYDKRTPMHVAAADGCLAAARCLVETLGARLSPTDRWGHTPLDDAVNAKRTDVAKYLRANGATHSSGFAARRDMVSTRRDR